MNLPAKPLNCSELAATLAELAMHISSEPGVKNIDDVVVRMRGFGGHLERLDVRTLSNAIVEASTGKSRTMTDLQRALANLKADARKNVQLQKDIDELQKQIRGELVKPKVGVVRPEREPAPSTVSLRQERHTLKKLVEAADRNIADLSRLAKEVAREKIEAGVTGRDAIVEAVRADLARDFPDLTTRQVAEAISDYGKTSSLSKDPISVALRDIRGQLQQTLKIEDMDAGQAPKRTGQERRTPSDEERRLIKIVNEKKKAGGYTVTDPATQLRTALDAAKTRMKNTINDLADQIIKREKLVKEKKAQPTDPELERMKFVRDQLREMYAETFGKEGLTDQQRLDIAIKAVDKSIAEYERRLAEQDYSPRPKPKPVTSAELEAKRAKRKELATRYRQLNPNTPAVAAARERLAELERHRAAGTVPPPRPVQERKHTGSLVLRGLRELIRKAEADIKASPAGREAKLVARLKSLEAKLASADELPAVSETPKPSPLTKRELRLMYDIRRAEQAIRDQLKQEPLSAERMVAGVVKAMQNWFGQGDQPLLRQGIVASGSHPITALKLYLRSWKAGFSKAEMEKVNREVENHEDRGLMEHVNLQFDGEFGKHQEFFLPSKVSGFPTVGFSERAFVTGMNGLRVKVWDTLKRMQVGKNGRDLTIDEASLIANAVNVATGKGHGKKAYRTTGEVQTFWSPGMQKARLKWLTGQPLWHEVVKNGKWNLMPKLRALIFWELYGKPAITALAVYALMSAMGYDISLDQLDSDFGKAKIGDTRTDMTGGMGQYVVLAARMITGKRKDAKTGGYVDADKGRLLWNFFRNKLNPGYATALNIAIGKNTVGEDRSILSSSGQLGLLKDLLVPPTYQDVLEIAKEQDLPMSVLTEILMSAGAGTQTYDATDGRGKSAPNRWNTGTRPKAPNRFAKN
jgi:hypothetical protein